MTTKVIIVTQHIKVTVDETKFTPTFMENFTRHFHPCEDVEAHMRHIATSYARGIIDSSSQFLEGYGELTNFGVKLKREDTEAEVVED